MSLVKAKMNSSQKIMMKDFKKEYFALLEKYWNPTTEDEYWDSLANEATTLIEEFQTDDVVLNDFLQNIVVAFLNSREELIS